MIIRVWGVVNSTEVEFTPISDRPGYWEGYAPRLPGLQEIEVWAESDSGLRGHLQCTVMLDYHAHTEARLLGDRMEASLIDAGDTVRLLLLPWVAQLVTLRSVDVLQDNYNVRLKGCRKAVRR
ncbi:MAG: hypothetical protein U0N43_07025 [Mediterraneibacter sp.]